MIAVGVLKTGEPLFSVVAIGYTKSVFSHMQILSPEDKWMKEGDVYWYREKDCFGFSNNNTDVLKPLGTFVFGGDGHNLCWVMLPSYYYTFKPGVSRWEIVFYTI